jgi:chitodextrinase
MKERAHFRHKKRIISAISALAMVVALFPVFPQMDVKAYSGTQSPLTLSTGTYTLDGVTIPATTGKAGIKISGEVILNISGKNTVNGGGGYAGINVPSGSSLTIQGTGTLDAMGGSAGGSGSPYIFLDTYPYGGSGGNGSGAGIGGNGGNGGGGGSGYRGDTMYGKAGENGQDCGTIIIKSGTVSATAGKPYPSPNVSGTGGNSSYGGSGSGGSGYAAAGIGGGGAGGGGGGAGGGLVTDPSVDACNGGGGGGGREGGGGGGGGGYDSWRGTNGEYPHLGDGGTGGASGNGADSGYGVSAGGGGGGVLSTGSEGESQEAATYKGSAGIKGGGGGGAGKFHYTNAQAGAGGDGGNGGKCGTVVVYPAASIAAYDNRIADNGYYKPVSGIGGGEGFTSYSDGTYLNNQTPYPPDRPSVTCTESDKQITLTWQTPEDNGLPITKYTLYRDDKVIADNISADTTSYTDTGLTNGTQYNYLVIAHNAIGASPPGSTSGTPRTVPSVPSIVVTPGDKQTTISWTAPANNGAAITKYEVKRGSTVLSSSVTGTSYTDTGLTNGTSYSYTVRAYNTAGWGAYSSSVSGTPRTVPSAPSAPTVSAGNAQVTISWAAPAANGASITNYEVFQNGVSIGTTTSLSMNKTGLNNGTEYTYTVRAYNAAGWGNQSAGAKATPYTAPSAPTIAVTAGNNSNVISWSAPSGNGASVTKYEISRKTGSGTYTVLSSTHTTTSYTDSSLTAGTAYTYRVRAYNNAGWGGYSAEKAGTPYAVPGAPSAPSVSPGNGQNVITWTAPANNGSTITKYELKRGDTVLKSDITGTTYTDTGLANGTSYSYTVRAYNAAGWGNFSAATAGIPRTVPAAPAINAAAGNKQNIISWSAPANNGATVTKYEISRKTGSGAYTVLNANVTGTSYTDPSLTAGTAYTYRVRAYNVAGWGGYSTEKSATPYTTPNAPGAPSVAPGNGQNVITWTAPANNGSTITKYELKRGDTVLKSDITGTTYTDTGLSNGTSYSYTVRAYNTAGWGSFSSAGSGTPRTVPAAPAITAAAGNKQNIISWSAPANNGATVTKYEISRKIGNGAYTVLNDNYTSTSYTDLSLTAETAYTYRVRAYNVAGWGNYSTEKSATPYTTPNAPSAPSVSPGNGQNVITWTAPANNGSTITKYELKRGDTVLKSDITGTTYTDTGLSNGTSYSYTVRAYNTAGWGSFSSAGSGTPRTVPSAPGAPKVTAGDKQVTISWTAPAANGATIDSYEVFQDGVSIGSTATTSMNKTGLANGTEYTYTVKAHNAVGWSAASAGTKATPKAIPSAPAIKVTPQNGSNLISWTAPAANGGTITKYEVKRGTTVLSDAVTGTSYTDTSLTNGTEYTYTVRAYNEVGWGAYSSSASGTPKTVPSAPAAPTVSPDNGSVTISWTAPAANGASITNYEVFQNGASIGTTTSLSMNKTGLLNGTEYTYTVRAYNAAGWGNQSAGTKATPRTIPSKPAAPGVTLGDKQVTVTWTAPAGNGASVTKYELLRNGTAVKSDITAISYTDTGLVNGTEYTYTVRAYNAAGWSTASDGTKAVPRAVPSAPSAPSVAPGDAQVTITWTAPANNGAAITNYEVFQDGVSIGTTTSLSMKKTGLKNGTSYTYTVRAYNAAGWGNQSAKSTAVVPRTVPTAPAAPTVSPGNGQNVITWTAPANGGATIDNYEVFQNGTSIGTTTSTTMTKTGLSNGTEYTYTVKAHNVAGWSAASAGTKATPRTAPGTPAAPTVSPGNGQNVITWTAPAANGASITKYELLRNGTAVKSDIATTTYTDTGLVNGTEYTYTVRAYNVAGWGNASAGTKATPRTVPTAPATPSVVPGDKQVTVTWTAPANGGAAITNYEVLRNGVSIKTLNALTYTDTGLTNGTEYTYTIRAYNAAGWSTASTGTKVTPRTVPSAPSAPSVTPGNKQVTVTWSAPVTNGASITKYELLRNGVTVKNDITATTYTDTGLTNQKGK